MLIIEDHFGADDLKIVRSYVDYDVIIEELGFANSGGTAEIFRPVLLQDDFLYLKL